MSSFDLSTYASPALVPDALVAQIDEALEAARTDHGTSMVVRLARQYRYLDWDDSLHQTVVDARTKAGRSAINLVGRISWKHMDDQLIDEVRIYRGHTIAWDIARRIVSLAMPSLSTMAERPVGSAADVLRLVYQMSRELPFVHDARLAKYESEALHGGKNPDRLDLIKRRCFLLATAASASWTDDAIVALRLAEVLRRWVPSDQKINQDLGETTAEAIEANDLGALAVVVTDLLDPGHEARESVVHATRLLVMLQEESLVLTRRELILGQVHRMLFPVIWTAYHSHPGWFIDHGVASRGKFGSHAHLDEWFERWAGVVPQRRRIPRYDPEIIR